MFRFTPYILKTLWRHRSRTLLTVSGSAVALFVFCFVGAMREGMHDLKRREEAGRSLISFQANKFCPATSRLPQNYERTIGRIPGVQEVVPIQVLTNNCRASLDVVVFHGLPAEMLRRVRALELVEGDWSQFERHQDAAVVGAAVARRRSVEVGSKFSIGNIRVTVAGIFTSDDPMEENYIYTHLAFLQLGRGEDRTGTVTQFEVLLEEGVDPLVKCQEIDAALKSGPAPTTTRPKGVFQAKSLGDLTQLIGMTSYLGYACVGLVMILVATTTLMSVQDRIKEHAVLQTIGFSSARVFGLVLTESILLSLAGGLIGVGAALITLQLSGLAIGAEGVMLAIRPTMRLAISAVGISLTTGLLAGLVPAWQAANTEIVPALRGST